MEKQHSVIESVTEINVIIMIDIEITWPI
jgi:hypothetical protein